MVQLTGLNNKVAVITGGSQGLGVPLLASLQSEGLEALYFVAGKRIKARR